MSHVQRFDQEGVLMLDRILVPLDGSAFAEWALPTAVDIAGRTGASVRLLAVVERPPVFVFPEQPDPDRDRIHAYLLSLAERILLRCPGKVDVVVREGWVAPEIEAEAEAWCADVIVMSTHGRSGLARLWKGSVAARCVEGGRCPVLLVRPPETGSADPTVAPIVARVVVPLDGSEVAERALEPAALLARSFGVHILLLSVRAEQTDADGVPGSEGVGIGDRDRAAALAYVKKQVARLRTSGVHSYGMLLSEPNPADTIADRLTGDVLVMATHGHDRLGRTLFGTVTDKVVRDASCLVMVIPPQGNQAALPEARPVSAGLP